MEGDPVPDTVFFCREKLAEDTFEWRLKTSSDIFLGKKIVLFGIPGAFTPICMNKHLPGFERNFSKFKSLGVDDVLCLSVNDAFVMFQWKRAVGVEGVKMLPDGNGTFTEAMGMSKDMSSKGFGVRSRRYSMFVNNGVIEKMFVEDDLLGDPFEVSDAETMLKFLRGNQPRKPSAVSRKPVPV